MVSAVLIAAVSNLDNLGVGVALGMRGTRIPAIPNLIIAAMTMGGTAAAMSSGRALSRLIDPSATASLGAVIIIAVGVASLLAPFAGRAPRRPRLSLHDVSRPGRGGIEKSISYREAVVLGLALALNNIGSGVGAGIAGIPPLETTLLAGAFSLLSTGGGSSAAQYLSRSRIGDRAPLASGLALLGVGIAMLFGVL